MAEILTEEWAAQEWLKLNWRDVEAQARKAIRSALTSHEKFIEVFREHMPAEDFSLAMAEIRERNKPIQNFCTVCGTEVEAARCSHVINDYGFIPDLCHLAYKHEGDHKWCRRCCLRFAGRCLECGSFPSMHLKDCPLASLPVGESTPKPRRLLDDNKPDGYMESNRDYVLNNIDLCVQWLDRATSSNDELGLGESREPLPNLPDQPSEPMSPASVRVVNSILEARVPESNFLRDEPELPSVPAEIEQEHPTVDTILRAKRKL